VTITGPGFSMMAGQSTTNITMAASMTVAVGYDDR